MDCKSDDEDFEMAMKPKLPVAQFDEYDPNTPPQSGAEYLRRVQLEACKEPDIKVATNLKIINYSKKKKTKQSELVDHEKDLNEFVKINPDLRLSESTSSFVIESFVKLRSHIELLRRKHEEAGTVPYRKLTRRWWKDYCLHKSPNCNVKYVNYTPEYCYDINLPRLDLICRLRQTEIIRLLGYHLEWIAEQDEEEEKDSCQFTPGNGLWIYALLAALDSVQPGDIYSLLRQLSRLCSHIRHRMVADFIQNKNLNTLASLNLIILLIGNYFGQKDLLDSYDEIQ